MTLECISILITGFALGAIWSTQKSGGCSAAVWLSYIQSTCCNCSGSEWKTYHNTHIWYVTVLF